MATRLRGVLPRVLPVLFAMFLVLFAAPQVPAAPAWAGRHGMVVSFSPASAQMLSSPAVDEALTEEEPAPPLTDRRPAVVVDRSVVLSAQLAADVRGSRAPPFTVA